MLGLGANQAMDESNCQQCEKAVRGRGEACRWHQTDRNTNACVCVPAPPTFPICLCPSPLPAPQAIRHAGISNTQPSSTAVAVGIASAEYNSRLVARYSMGISAYSATGGAQSVASGRLRCGRPAATCWAACGAGGQLWAGWTACWGPPSLVSNAIRRLYASLPTQPNPPNRLCSYTFAFKGPAVSVDTACSSSLVAAHLAAGNLFGGVTVSGLVAGAGLLLSPDTTGTVVCTCFGCCMGDGALACVLVRLWGQSPALLRK